MKNKLKTHITVTHQDDKENDLVKIMILEGPCSRCKDRGGNNNLVILNFKPNKANTSQSLFETVCLCCFRKSIIYLVNVNTNQ
jgi:hypothetical protein